MEKEVNPIPAEFRASEISTEYRELAEIETLPKGWREIALPWEVPKNAQRAYRRTDGLVVVVDCAKKADGKFWLHLSCSYRNRLPSHYDLSDVKRIFLGPERMAIHCYPPESTKVNIHQNCLHLWSCMDEFLIPDFSYGLNTI